MTPLPTGYPAYIGKERVTIVSYNPCLGGVYRVKDKNGIRAVSASIVTANKPEHRYLGGPGNRNYQRDAL